MRPTSRGWGALVLVAGCLVLGQTWRYPGLTGVGAALAALVVMDAASLALAGTVTVRRTIVPAEVPRFGDCAVRLSFAPARGTGWLPVRAAGIDHVAGVPVPFTVGRLDRGARRLVRYTMPTAHRGRHVVGPLVVRRFGLAGLTVASGDVGGPAVARVLPRALPVRAVPPGAWHSHVGADERAVRGGTDIIGLREYQPGDDLRRVHWGTSARIGTLMVREDADPVRAHLTVSLDDRSASYAGAPDPFEEAVEVAASLVSAADAEGHPVRLCSVRGGLDLTTAEDGIETLMDALTDVSLVEGDGTPGWLGHAAFDIVAVITGEAADLAGATSHVEAGGILVVGEARPAADAGAVAVLRAPRADELCSAWDERVSSRMVRA